MREINYHFGNNFSKIYPEIEVFKRQNYKNFEVTCKELSYTVRSLTFRKKTIVNCISGSFRSGQIMAVLGPSGCGKSTVIQLVQRFYDTLEGQVLIDGQDIRQLNIGWLRDHIGVVGGDLGQVVAGIQCERQLRILGLVHRFDHVRAHAALCSDHRNLDHVFFPVYPYLPGNVPGTFSNRQSAYHRRVLTPISRPQIRARRVTRACGPTSTRSRPRVSRPA